MEAFGLRRWSRRTRQGAAAAAVDPRGESRPRRARHGRRAVRLRPPDDVAPPALLVLAAALRRSSPPGCGNEKETAPRRDRGRLPRRRRLKYQVQISRYLNPDDIEDASTSRGLPRATSSCRPTRPGSASSCASRTTTDGRSRRPSDYKIADTQGNEYRPVALDPEQPVRLPSRPTWAPSLISRSPTRSRGQGVDPGRALLFKLKTTALQNRPLELQISNTQGADGRQSTSTSSAARPPASDLLARAGAAVVAAGALADEQHGDRDARVPGRRVRGEPGVRVGLVVLGRRLGRLAPAAAARRPRDGRPQLGGAGLARDRDAGDRGGAPGPRRTTRAHVAADRARARRRRGRTRRAAAPASVGTGRRPRSPIAAAIVAISSGVASTLPWPIALEPTARSSPISRAAGIVERAAPAAPGSR